MLPSSESSVRPSVTFSSRCKATVLIAALFCSNASFAASSNAAFPSLDVLQSAQRALERYQRAAAAGSSAAQNSLGIAYLTGRGVDRDIATAFDWLTRAADQGNSDARYNLRAACHTVNNPPVICSQRRISTASYFQHPGAKVLWRGDPSN